MIGNNDKYLYNNTALCVMTVLSVMKACKKVPLCNALLICPLLMHNQTLTYFKGRRKPVSLEELITNEQSLIIGFNDRFYSFLTPSFNAISICIEANLLDISNGNLVALKAVEELDYNKFGNRASDIAKAIKTVSGIFTATPADNYLQLRIIL